MDNRKSWQDIANERTLVIANHDYYESIQIQDAVIMSNGKNREQKTFRNFEGSKDRNGKSQRKFNVVIPENAIQGLMEMGYYIRHYSSGSDESPQDTYFLEIKINPEPGKDRPDLSKDFVDAITPNLYLVSTWNGRTSKLELEVPMYGSLDFAYIQTADIIFRPRKLEQPTPKGNTKTAWLIGKNYFVTEERGGEVKSSSRFDDEEVPFK